MIQDNTCALPRLQRYRFDSEASQDVSWPAYTGSMWRGLLGHGLRQSACVTRQKDCNGCLLIDSCVYNRVFESRNGAAHGRFSPHPFTLQVVNDASRDARRTQFGITLFEQVDEALPYIIHGIGKAGKLGIGREHVPFSLVNVSRETSLGSEQWKPIWSPGESLVRVKAQVQPELPGLPSTLRVVMQTPLRLKSRGRLVGPNDLTAELFLHHLWQRVSAIGHFYPGSLDLPMPAGRPAGFQLDGKGLRWHDLRRYSSRQQTAMYIGGLLGEFALAGDELETWWPIIWYGQWLHLGKNTSMGLGKYRVDVE